MTELELLNEFSGDCHVFANLQRAVKKCDVDDDFLKRVLATFGPFYSFNDTAHDINHAMSVAEKALGLMHMCRNPNGTDVQKLITKEDRQYLKPELVILGAFAHDMLAWERDNHEGLAMKFVMTSRAKLLTGLTSAEVSAVALAAGEHRGSKGGTYTTILSQIVATADRGDLVCDHSRLTRAYHYGVEVKGQDSDEAMVHAINIMKEKYGHNGTAAYPPLYYAVHGKAISSFRDWLDGLSVEKDGAIVRTLATK